MIISFPAKDGDGYLQFDLSRPDFSPDYIRKYAKGVASIRLSDGEIYDVPADKFGESHAEWLRANMAKDHMHPRDADASLFSRDAGLAVKEQLAELAGARLTADTPAGQVMQVAKKAGTALLQHATNIQLTAQKALPYLIDMPIADENRERVSKLKEESKKYYEKAYDAMGGRDVYSGIGNITAEALTMGGVYTGVKKAVLKAVPALAPRAGQTIMTALKAGDLPMATRLMAAAKAAGFEAGVAGASAFAHRVGVGGTLEEAATEAMFAAPLAGVSVGAGTATLGVRSARKKLVAELANKVDDAVNAAAKEEVGMRLWQAAQDAPITNPQRLLVAGDIPRAQLVAGTYQMPGEVYRSTAGMPMTMERVKFEFGEEVLSGLPDIGKSMRPYAKPTATGIQPGVRGKIDVEPEPFSGEYLRRGSVEKTRELYRERKPAELLSDMGLEPTSPEAYMSLAQQRPGEAGFIRVPWNRRADDLDDAVAAVSTKDAARQWLARQAQAAISDTIPLKNAAGEEAFFARKTLSGAAAEGQMNFSLGKYAMREDGVPYQTSKESMGTWTVEPLVEKMGRTKVKRYKKIDGLDGDKYLHQYRTGRMLAGELTENPNYTLPKGWTRDRIRNVKARFNALAEADPALYAAVREADHRTNRFYNLVLREMYEYGRIGKGDYANIVAHYKKYGYHPLRRVEDVNIAEQYFTGSKVAPKAKKRTAGGTEKQLLDSADDMERYYITNHMANRKNKFFSDITDQLKKNPETAEFIEESIVEKAGKKAVWTFDDVSIKPLVEGLGEYQYRYQKVVDGFAKTWTVKVKSPELFQAITTASVTDASALAKAATWVAKLKRASIIYTAAFLERSTFKGGLDAAVQAQWARPVHQMLKENGIAALFSKEFANSNVMPWVLPKTWAETIAIATKTVAGLDVRNALKATLGQEGASLKYLNNYLVQSGGGGMVGEGLFGVLENSWRNHAAYMLLRQSIKRGEDVTTPEFAQRMAILRRELGGDYMEKGFKMRAWGSKVPFLNASIAGLRSNFRRLIDDPLGMTLRMAQVGAAPAVIGFAMMKDDPEYQALTPFERVSRMYYAPGVWVPRPYGLVGFVHYGVEEVLRLINDTSPQDFQSVLAAAQYAFINTPVPSWADTALTVVGGYSLFQGRFLEPDWMKRELPPEQRTNIKTSAAAKAVSEAVPIVSPIRIDATVDAILGPIGNVAMQAVSVPVATMRGEVPPTKHISSNKFIETATRIPPTERASGYVSSAYDLSKTLNDYEKRLKVATPERRRELRANNPFIARNASKIKMMREIAKSAQDFEREVTMGEKLKGLTGDAKAQKIRENWKRANGRLAKTWKEIEASREALNK